MPNLDDMAGVLVRPLQLFRSRPRNTLDRLHAYEGVSREELFPAPDRIPRVQTSRRWSLPGFENEDLSFASLHEPIEPLFNEHYHARRRRIQTVYAKRIRPNGTAGRPRLLYIHGYMQPETVIEEHGLLGAMARTLDMEIVQLQPPYHGRRKPRSSPYDGERYWTADVVRSFEAIRQTILDARTLLSVMLDESPGPVGVAGLSLGGSFAATLACLEPRFDFSAPFVAHMDMGALLRDAPVLGPMRKDLARFGWAPRDFGDFFTRIGWDELEPVIPADRILLFAAEKDHFFEADVLRTMWSRWGEPEIHWYRTSHMGFVPHMLSATGHLRRFINGLAPR
ncbi:MAG: alpha/beta hydrolase family protein [Deltaproteobacteria bacterium]|nr:alpha/beta hydrolase family protein [Deltaproteobacteria bacterium]